MKSNKLILCTDNSCRRHLTEVEVPSLILLVNVALRLRRSYFIPSQPSPVSLP